MLLMLLFAAKLTAPEPLSQPTETNGSDQHRKRRRSKEATNKMEGPSSPSSVESDEKKAAADAEAAVDEEPDISADLLTGYLFTCSFRLGLERDFHTEAIQFLSTATSA